ncbi:glycerol-3-phosphate 1-O-acyltransferase PlsY [Alphaproteobacteria bacterium]|jgi:acyl phosphate:glycerol-3-phosphate acyltransferase|nr:glycerol-3-phosphate 1-O-acyltransferase PlsY [Alphaproteobacteria bacterium]
MTTFAELAPLTAIAVLVGYLAGSIPFGLFFTKLAGLGDIRDIGSGNIGATNVLRTGNKTIAIATLLADALKAAIPVAFFAHQFGDEVAAVAAVAGFLGHVFPVWLNFKGGKGIAVFIGMLFAQSVTAGAIFCGLWIITALITRISSLSALVACGVIPIIIYFTGNPVLAICAAILAALAFWAHRENIKRLAAGTEPRIGGNKKQ